MRRILSLALSTLLLLTLIAGCTKPDGSGKELTVEDRTKLYKDALESVLNDRVGTGQPPLVTGDDVPEFTFELLGVKPEDLSAFAIDVALINISAYGIVIAYPAEGKSDAVMESLKEYIAGQKQSFENYLPNQYEVAKNAKLERLDDGTFLLVMSEGQDEIFTSLKAAINEGVAK